MSDDSSITDRLSRREVLAAFLTGSAAVTSWGSFALREDEPESVSTPVRPDLPVYEPEPPDRDPPDEQPPVEDPPEDEPPEPTPPGENIRDYGAKPNPDDASAQQASRNLAAIHAAANAAGEGGTVYIPEGTYYFGHDGTGVRFLNRFGPREPAGISLVGAGPRDSILAVSEHMPPEQNHFAFYWWEGYDHGTVEIKDICLDGNYENIGNLSAADSGSRACVIRDGAEGNFEFANVHCRGWYTNGIYLTDVSGFAKYCTFEENAIGLNKDTNGDIISHHTAIRPKSGNEFVFDHCHFRRCSGSAVNIGEKGGNIRLRDCYGEGLGSGVHKISGGNLITNERCYWEPNTEWLEKNLPNGTQFYGNNLAHRLAERASVTPTYVLNNVEVRKTTGHAIETRAQTALTIEGDLIAVHDAAQDDGRDSVFRDDSDGELRNVNVGRLSVHNSDAAIFSTPHATGKIMELNYRNTAGLGETGDLDIRVERDAAYPFAPDVPSREEVGIGAEKSDSSDS